MPLTQQMMDRAASYIAAELESLTGPVTYRHKASQNATAQTYTIEDGRLSEYSLNEFSRDTTILSNDRRFRVPTGTTPVPNPTRWDEIDDSSGATWRVVSWRYGPGYPFYDIQLRQVG
jgi:hypothetical protein